jgi:hypothetical protein
MRALCALDLISLAQHVLNGRRIAWNSHSQVTVSGILNLGILDALALAST